MVYDEIKNSLRANLYANYFGFIAGCFSIGNSILILLTPQLLFQYRFQEYFGNSQYVLYIMYRLFLVAGLAVVISILAQNEKCKRIFSTLLSSLWFARFLLFLFSPPVNTYYAQSLFLFLILIGVTMKEVRVIGKQQ